MKVNAIFQKISLGFIFTLLINNGLHAQTDTPKGEMSFYGHKEFINDFKLSPDGRRLASCAGLSDKADLRLFDTESGEQLRILTGHYGSVRALSFTTSGKHLVSGCWDKNLIVWESETGKLYRTLKGHTTMISHLAISSSDKYIASYGCNLDFHELFIWEFGTGKVIKKLNDVGNVSSLDFLPNTHILAVAHFDKSISFWDISTGEKLAFSSAYEQAGGGMFIHPDLGRLATWGASAKGTVVKFWDMKSHQELLSFKDNIFKLIISKDGKYMIGTFMDFYEFTTSLQVFDAQNGKILKSVAIFHQTGNALLALSPDGKKIYVAGSEEHHTAGGKERRPVIRVWDFEKILHE